MGSRPFRLLIVACLLFAYSSPWLQPGMVAGSEATPVVEEDPTATPPATETVTLTVNGSESSSNIVTIDENVNISLSSGTLAFYLDPECAGVLATFTGGYWSFPASELLASYGSRFWLSGTSDFEQWTTGCRRVDIVDPSIPTATPVTSVESATLAINGSEEQWLTFAYGEEITATFSSERLALFQDPGCDRSPFGSSGGGTMIFSNYEIDQFLGETFSVQGTNDFGTPVTTCRNITITGFPTPIVTPSSTDTQAPSHTPLPTNTPAPTITTAPSMTTAPTYTHTPAISPTVTATPTLISNVDANQCQTLANAGLIDAFGLAYPRDITFSDFIQQVRAYYPAMSLNDITWLYYGQCHAYVVATPTSTVTFVPIITNTPTWRLTPDPTDPLFTICHWQPSTSTYISIETNPSYILYFSDFMGGADIIPPFTYQGVTYSQNWNTYGQEVLSHGCQVIADPQVRFCNWNDIGGYYIDADAPVSAVLEGFYQVPGHEQDIIPPFRTVVGLHPALNWTATTQAIWENNCKIPSEITPPPTNTPMPTFTPTTTPQPAANSSQIRICHALSTGGYSSVVVGANGVKNGHLSKDPNDIVPPFTLNFALYSQNWTTEGQAIWNNGCVAPPS
ncbi:MAG: hypothetical protein WBA46_16375 [Thermomicrobiales bacterium]